MQGKNISGYPGAITDKKGGIVAECVFLPARWRYVVISAYINPSHFFCDPSHLPVI